MDLALKHSAVLLRPNYRKLPESTGLQILEGFAEFWKWFWEGGLQAAVVVGSATKEGEVELDAGRTLLVGHSAGMFVLSFPPLPFFCFCCLFFLALFLANGGGMCQWILQDHTTLLENISDHLHKQEPTSPSNPPSPSPQTPSKPS